MKSIVELDPEEDRLLLEQMLNEINASNEDWMNEMRAEHEAAIQTFIQEMENEQPPEDVTVLEESFEDCPDQGKK